MSKKTETVQNYWDARSDLFGNYYKKLLRLTVFSGKGYMKGRQ